MKKNFKRYLVFGTLFFLAASIILGGYIVNRQGGFDIRKKAASAPSSQFYLSGPATVGVGQTFSVDIILDTTNDPTYTISGADAVLTITSSPENSVPASQMAVLQSVKPGNLFDNMIYPGMTGPSGETTALPAGNTPISISGVKNYSLNSEGNFNGFSGRGVFATLTFIVKSPGKFGLNIVYTGVNATDDSNINGFIALQPAKLQKPVERLKTAPQGFSRAVIAATPTTTPVGYGTYDDTDPHIVYSGNWEIYNGGESYNKTIHYSNQIGATASFTFTGESVSLLYTGDPQRGTVSVSIDNKTMAPIIINEQTSARLWQSKWTSSNLTSGIHTIIFTNNSGPYVDIDAIIVGAGTLPSAPTPTPTPTFSPAQTLTPTPTVSPAPTPTPTPLPTMTLHYKLTMPERENQSIPVKIYASTMRLGVSNPEVQGVNVYAASFGEYSIRPTVPQAPRSEQQAPQPSGQPPQREISPQPISPQPIPPPVSDGLYLLGESVADANGEGSFIVNSSVLPTTGEMGITWEDQERLNQMILYKDTQQWQFFVQTPSHLMRKGNPTFLSSTLDLVFDNLVPGDIYVAEGQKRQDGVINSFDSADMFSNWGSYANTSAADLNADNIVNNRDLALLYANFGKRGDITSSPTPEVTSGITDPGCVRTGCSGQGCMSEQQYNENPFFTTCEWKEEYHCAQLADCKKQSDGTCKGINNTASTTCYANIPTTTPGAR